MVKYLSIDNLQTLDIGHASDHQTGEVSIDCSAWRKKYPALTEYNLFVTNPAGMIYPANTVMTEDGKLLWNICDADTSVPGVGRYQIIATGRYGDRKASKYADLTIAANMPGMDGADPPDPSKAWVGSVIDARREAEDAARAAADSAEAVAHPPIIGENGNWWLWDNAIGAYADSGFDSRPAVAPYTLPTASETVKGGVKVGKGLVMDGDVLRTESSKPFELINEITVAEDVEMVELSADSAGNALALSKMRIKIEAPAVAANANMHIGVDSNKTWLGTTYVSNFAATDGKRTTVMELKAVGGYWQITIYASGASGVITAVQSKPESIMAYPASHEDYLMKTQLYTTYTNTVIPTGTKISVYGVRK